MEGEFWAAGMPLEVGKGIGYEAGGSPALNGAYPMPVGTFEYRSERERIAIERAIAFVAEMHSLAQTAPDGQVLHACEAHALDAGRDLLRSTLRHAAQQRVDAAEKKGAPPAPARAQAPSASSGAAGGRS
jgi:hypothetical protein